MSKDEKYLLMQKYYPSAKRILKKFTKSKKKIKLNILEYTS